MSVNDMIKKSVLNSFSQYNVPKMALALLVALLVGIVIYCVYRRFYTGVVYSRSFAVTLVGMCVLTCMVTLAISTNVVISLGMVGALSIVRFRTAVKDPVDLMYLFWSVAAGIATGARLYYVVLYGNLIIAAAVILFTRLRWNEKSYLLVISCESGALASVEALLAACKTSLRGKVCAGGRVELTVELKSACGADLPERIGALPGVESASLVSYNGDYAA